MKVFALGIEIKDETKIYSPIFTSKESLEKYISRLRDENIKRIRNLISESIKFVNDAAIFQTVDEPGRPSWGIKLGKNLPPLDFPMIVSSNGKVHECTYFSSHLRFDVVYDDSVGDFVSEQEFRNEVIRAYEATLVDMVSNEREMNPHRHIIELEVNE